MQQPKPHLPLQVKVRKTPFTPPSTAGCSTALWKLLQSHPKGPISFVTLSPPSSPTTSKTPETSIRSLLVSHSIRSKQPPQQAFQYTLLMSAWHLPTDDHINSLICEVDDEAFGIMFSISDSDNNMVESEALMEVAFPLALDEVILRAHSHASFHNLKDPNQPDLLSKYASQRSLVLRQNSRISLGQQLFQVLWTSPFKQGVLTPSTNIVVSDNYQNQNEKEDRSSTPSSWSVSSQPLLPIEETNPNEQAEFPTPFPSSPTTESTYTTSETHLPVFSSSLFRRTALFTTSRSSPPFKPLKWQLQIESKANLSDLKSIVTNVFVSWKSLAILGLLDGSWCRIIAGKRSRSCKIHGLDAIHSKEGHVIYMSPILMHNIGITVSPIVRLVNPSFCSDSIHIESQNESGNEPDVAVSCTLSRLSTLPTLCSHSVHACELALTQYFTNHKRVVALNDLLIINIAGEFQWLEKLGVNPKDEKVQIINKSWKRLAESQNTFAYYIVTGLEGGKNKDCIDSGLLVDPNITKLVTVGVSHDFLPVDCIFSEWQETSIPPPSLEQNGKVEHSIWKEFSALYQICLTSFHPVSSTLGLSGIVLLHGRRGVGKKTCASWVAESLGLHFYEINCHIRQDESPEKLKSNFENIFELAQKYSPCILYLNYFEAFFPKSPIGNDENPSAGFIEKKLLDFVNSGKGSDVRNHVFVICATEDREKLPDSTIGIFRQEILFETPDEIKRENILKSLTPHFDISSDVNFLKIAIQSAGLVCSDLVKVVDQAIQHSVKRLQSLRKQHQLAISDFSIHGVSLYRKDFEDSINKARESLADAIGAPKIPNVTWDDVGGLASVKADILDTIQLPLEQPELFASGMKKRSGILFYGPPGTGKTLLAKAVATECSLNFLSIKGPELLNMYIGESEANVRRVFQRAREARPCVIFFDELDSVAPKRGAKGDSGGVMDRIVSQLLAELDGVHGGSESSGNVFVIGATNRPDLLDPALLRPGRFDKLLYLGISEDKASQAKIIRALTRKFTLGSTANVDTIASHCPPNMTGADFYALCSDAILKAMMRRCQEVDMKIEQLQKHLEKSTLHGSKHKTITPDDYFECYAEPGEDKVKVELEDFMLALKNLIPSVSMEDLARYHLLRDQFNRNHTAST